MLHKTLMVAIAAGAIAAGTASATSLGIAGPTTFAADDLVLTDCQFPIVEILPTQFPELAQPDVIDPTGGWMQDIGGLNVVTAGDCGLVTKLQVTLRDMYGAPLVSPVIGSSVIWVDWVGGPIVSLESPGPLNIDMEMVSSVDIVAFASSLLP